MRNSREIKTCSRCRQLKLRCDRAKPSCQRCTEAKAGCSFGVLPTTPAALLELPSSLSIRVPETVGEVLTPQSITDSPPPRFVSDGIAGRVQAAHGAARAGEDTRTVKRRQRAHLSCTRCFRLKVKCDKETPCRRCRLSGWGGQCAYKHRVEGASPSSTASPELQAIAKGNDADHIISSWRTQRRGATHWKGLLSQLKLEAGTVDIAVCDVVVEIIRAKGSVEAAGDSALPSNFPFSSPEATRYASLGAVHDLLQSHRDRCSAYVDAYLVLFQPIHPIIDVAPFCRTVDQFWNSPRKAVADDVSWLASFLMVLALGCFAATRDPAPMAELCMAAEACLSKTPFLVQPDLAAIRTLCLMVVAKQTANTTCRTFDACWALLGLVVRVAVGMGLNQQQQQPPEQSQSATRKLWAVIVYFCIHTATVAGKPPLLSAGDIIVPTTTNHAPLSSCSTGTDDPWTLLLEASPKICEVLARLNSDDANAPSYAEVQQYNDRLRQSLARLDVTVHVQPLLRTALDVFFRRVLLVLHRRHALLPRAPVQHPVSYFSSLECSLAVLVHHRDLCEHHHSRHSPGSDRGGSNIDLLGRLFKLDVFAAMLTACLHLLRHGAPPSSPATPQPPHAATSGPTATATATGRPDRQTIVAALQACTEIWARETHSSVCFAIGHRLLTAVLAVVSNADEDGLAERRPSLEFALLS